MGPSRTLQLGPSLDSKRPSLPRWRPRIVTRARRPGSGPAPRAPGSRPARIPSGRQREARKARLPAERAPRSPPNPSEIAPGRIVGRAKAGQTRWLGEHWEQEHLLQLHCIENVAHDRPAVRVDEIAAHLLEIRRRIPHEVIAEVRRGHASRKGAARGTIAEQILCARS